MTTLLMLATLTACDTPGDTATPVDSEGTALTDTSDDTDSGAPTGDSQDSATPTDTGPAFGFLARQVLAYRRSDSTTGTLVTLEGATVTERMAVDGHVELAPDGRVIAWAPDGTVTWIDLDTGTTETWSLGFRSHTFTTCGSGLLASPWESGGTELSWCDASGCQAIDVTDWHAHGGSATFHPAVGGSSHALVGQTWLYAHATTRAVRFDCSALTLEPWLDIAGQEILGVGDTLYVPWTTYSSRIYSGVQAFDATTGSELWAVEEESRTLTAAVADADLGVLAHRTDTLYSNPVWTIFGTDGTVLELGAAVSDTHSLLWVPEATEHPPDIAELWSSEADGVEVLRVERDGSGTLEVTGSTWISLPKAWSYQLLAVR